MLLVSILVKGYRFCYSTWCRWLINQIQFIIAGVSFGRILIAIKNERNSTTPKRTTSVLQILWANDFLYMCAMAWPNLDMILEGKFFKESWVYFHLDVAPHLCSSTWVWVGAHAGFYDRNWYHIAHDTVVKQNNSIFHPRKSK